MRTWTLAFLTGILSLTFLPELPPLYITVSIACLAICLLFIRSRVRLAGVFLLGFLFATARAEMILSDALDRSDEGETLSATGVIVSLPAKRRHSIRFEFHIKSLRDQSGQRHPPPGKVLLYWYTPPKEVRAGEAWRLSIRLKRPYGFRNPGGFDYEGWLFRQHIRATGYVVKDKQNVLIEYASPFYIHNIRQYLRERIYDYLEYEAHMPLVTALALGDRSLIESSMYRILLDTGTNHLLAISGLHIGLVSVLVYLLASRVFRYSGRLLNIIPAQYMAAVMAVIAATTYAMLAGMSVSTQRALVMTAVFWVCMLGKHLYSMATIFCIAVIMVLLIDPFAVMSPAFWLSFGAVGLILFGMRCRLQMKGFWWRWGRAQYVVAIGLLPVLLFSFQQYAVTGFLANLIAIPWVSLAVVPPVLAGVCLIPLGAIPATLLLKLAEFNLSLIWPVLEYLAQLDFALWEGPSPQIAVLVLALVGVFLILLPRGMPGRWLGYLWLLPVFLPYQVRPPAGETWLTLLDVGQGMAAVIRTREHVLVYDTGARFSETFEAGAAVLVPYLKSGGIAFIDKVVLSHGDNDHIGGSDTLLEKMDYGMILTSVPDKVPHARTYACHRGQRWVWDGITFEILHPAKDKQYSDNNRSCVLKVSAGSNRLLLTGDIERDAELELLNIYQNQLAAQVMTAPHHGSKSSSLTEFIKAVNPDAVLFPVGYRNRFRLPNVDIITRYRALGIMRFDTARHGAILVKSGRNKITVTTYRQQSRRFWHSEM